MQFYIPKKDCCFRCSCAIFSLVKIFWKFFMPNSYFLHKGVISVIDLPIKKFHVNISYRYNQHWLGGKNKINMCSCIGRDPISWANARMLCPFGRLERAMEVDISASSRRRWNIFIIYFDDDDSSLNYKYFYLDDKPSFMPNSYFLHKGVISVIDLPIKKFHVNISYRHNQHWLVGENKINMSVGD